MSNLEQNKKNNKKNHSNIYPLEETLQKLVL